jgi:hypothetical protein
MATATKAARSWIEAQNKTTKFRPFQKHFVHLPTGKRLRGVHGVLKAAFEPPAAKFWYRNNKAPAHTVSIDGCHGSSDCDHGSCVDKDIEFYVNKLKGTASIEDWKAKTLVKLHRTCDPCSIRFVQYIQDVLHWKFVSAQVRIASPALRIGTAVDLVCSNHTGTHIYFVEMKTTKHTNLSYYKERSPTKLLRLSKLSYSFLHMDLLQTYLNEKLIQENKPPFVFSSCLIRIGAKGKVWKFEVPETWSKNKQFWTLVKRAITEK